MRLFRFIQSSLPQHWLFIIRKLLITTYREGGKQIDSDADLMDNSALVCLEKDGLIVKGCKKQSTVIVSYPELADSLRATREKTRPIKVKPIEPMPPVGSFLFNPEGLRDPFSPIEKSIDNMTDQVIATSGIQPDFNRHKEELESYSFLSWHVSLSFVPAHVVRAYGYTPLLAVC